MDSWGHSSNRSRCLSLPACKIVFSLLLLTTAFLVICNALLVTWKGHDVEHFGHPTLPARHAPGKWVDTWTAVPQALDTATLPAPFNQTKPVLADTTIRQTVQISVGSAYIRLRISNAFGTSDLPIDKVTVSLPLPQYGHYLGSSRVDNETIRSVTFSGSDWLIIPDGALAVSDPITFSSALEPGSVITISMHISEGQASEYITSHVLSLTTSWLAPNDQTEAAVLRNTKSNPHWYFIGAVEAWKDADSAAFAIIGDSITDGRGVSHMNTNTRWPSLLFKRTQATTGLQGLSIANQGAGGNQLLYDGKGPNAASRIDRDLLAQSGLKYAMLFEGVNDIGHALSTDSQQKTAEARLIHFYKQIITRVHSIGIPIFGATITPFACSNPTSNLWASDHLRERTRQAVNKWIRTSGWFDAVVDFDQVLRDPQNHTRLTPRFSSADCLHPNELGYKEMADKFPLDLFDKFKGGVDNFVK